MNQSEPQNTTPTTQTGPAENQMGFDRRIGLYTGIGAGLIGLLFLSQGVTHPVIQLYIVAAVFMLVALVNIFSLESITFKDPRTSVYLGLSALQLALVIFAHLFTNTSLISASLIIIIGVFTISGQFRGRDVDLGLIITLVAAMLSGLAGTLTTIGQYDLNNFPLFMRIMLIAIVVAYIVMLGIITIRSLTSTISVKLITSSLAITLVPLLLLSTIQTDFIRTIVQNQTNQALKLAGEETANRIDAFFSDNLDQIERAANLAAFINYLNIDPTERNGSSQEQQLALTINSLKAQQEAYLTSIGLLDLQGNNIYDSNPFEVGNSEDTSEYFVQPLRTGQIFVSSVLFSDQNGDAYLYFSAPVRNASGQMMGVLRMRYDALVLQDRLGESINLLGARSYPMLVDELNIRIADLARPSEVYKAIAPLTADQIASIQKQKRLPNLPAEQLYTNLPEFAASLDQIGNDPYFNTYLYESGTEARGMSGVAIRLKNKPWNVVFLQERTALINLLQERNRTSSLIAILLAGFVGLITVIFARLFSRPILSLRETAANIAGGDINAQATITTRDEIGALGETFNLMTQQLRGFIGELENRVNERTVELARQNESLQLRSQQLQTVSDVARQIVSARELETLLNQVTVLISDRFNFYHVGIFLVDQNNEYALLRAANSEGGQRMLARGHKLRVGEVGMVGYVTGAGQPRIATDVGKDAVFFNNPDLPETRSEMALPLKVGDEVIGALDVQSVVSNAFTAEDISLFSTLADQVAIAIRNNQLYSETMRALQESQKLHQQYLQQEWGREAGERGDVAYIYTPGGMVVRPYINTPEVERVFETRQPVIKQAEATGDRSVMAIPVMLRDEVIGIIHLQEAENTVREWSNEEVATVQSVADQVGQALENARLFERTVRRAERERKVLDITSRIRASNDPQQMVQIALEELQRALRVSRAQVLVQTPPSLSEDQDDSDGESPAE